MRRLVLAGLVVSVAGNLLSAVAHGFVLFLIGRGVLGLSAASPLVYAILRARSTSDRRINRGVGILTVAIGAGIAVSYLLSGVIIEANGSVRTVFWAMTALSARSPNQSDPAGALAQWWSANGALGLAAFRGRDAEGAALASATKEEAAARGEDAGLKRDSAQHRRALSRKRAIAADWA